MSLKSRSSKISQKELRFFQAAKRASKHSTYSDRTSLKMGAVITKNGKLISSSANRKKTHPRGSGWNSRIHCEIGAIIQALARGIDLDGAYIYVYRQYDNGRLAMARPCGHCEKQIKKQGFRGMYYTNKQGYEYERME